jgi:ribosome biogenesis GTPase A
VVSRAHAPHAQGHCRAGEDIDVVIEMLDARLPGSSANPLLAELTGRKPTLKVLNKQDLADPARTALWLAHYNAQPATRAIALDASHSAPARAMHGCLRELAPNFAAAWSSPCGC